MKEIIDVSTGEVKIGNSNNIIVSYGIGSCIAVAAIHLEKRIGGIAHIMLPGKAPLNEKISKTKYTEDAIDVLMRLLEIEKTDTSQIKVCLIGAGNVLNYQDDTICKSNTDSLLNLLNELKIEISAQSLGGNLRRSVRFDIETGKVFFAEGDSELILLKHWK